MSIDEFDKADKRVGWSIVELNDGGRGWLFEWKKGSETCILLRKFWGGGEINNFWICLRRSLTGDYRLVLVNDIKAIINDN